MAEPRAKAAKRPPHGSTSPSSHCVWRTVEITDRRQLRAVDSAGAAPQAAWLVGSSMPRSLGLHPKLLSASPRPGPARIHPAGSHWQLLVSSQRPPCIPAKLRLPQQSPPALLRAGGRRRRRRRCLAAAWIEARRRSLAARSAGCLACAARCAERGR